MKNITIKTEADGFIVAVLDMPGRPFNVFSEDMMADLETLIEQVLTDCNAGNAPKGLVLTSGKSSFVAGADLGMIQDFGAMRFTANWQQMRDRYSNLGKLFRRLETLPVPVVAAVNGLALGGGFELAMACHGRVCVDAPHAQLGLPEVVLGLLPGAGGTQRLPRYIGLAPGLEMLLGGASLSPSAALERGVVDKLASQEDLISSAISLAGEISAGARWDKEGFELDSDDLAKIGDGFNDWALALCGIDKNTADLYPAIPAILKCVGDGFAKDIDAGSDVEWDVFVDLMSDPVASNMVTTCFLAKTAATKLSLAQLPKVEPVASYAALDGVELNPKVFRKVTQLASGEAELNVGPVGDEAADVFLAAQSASTPASGATPEFRFVGDFTKSEVLELYVGTDLEKAAKAMSLAQTSGKSVVLSRSAESVNKVLLATCGAIAANSDAQALTRAVAAVGLSKQMAEALSVDYAPTLEVQAADKQFGLDILAELSLAVATFAAAALTGDEDKDATLLAGIDLLSVYGTGFPKWSGGPLSCLTMFQRGELSSSKMNIADLEWTFKSPWGYKASKAS
ncbi:enoyl-CoA hydratase/carnithine racemase [Spongiibacter sp. IMCC21906]|uniref:enoyl-CoA hydratase-related protein n=1 Tax=Spongiibacter sp. IMCC21906 TaxID=1620392 RepID=UPI00062DDF04|nr:enoyl-CoA hydratase-related protein [Spongiibacter sp. IMCC21906]AKH69064.1 enoyl-CoA hydratase/carnithine racemase [Spongiibacter sp. IMCC21906]